MRYRITDEIRAEIRKTIGEERGAGMEMCRRTQLSPPLFYTILNGKHKVLQEDTWNRLCYAIPSLMQLACPVIPADGRLQRPLIHNSQINLDHSRGVINSDATGKPCAVCRQKLSDAILALDIQPDAKIKVLDALKLNLPE